jgi:spore maturation protein CgeB
MKILHIGLCVNPNGYSSFPQAFKDIIGEGNYREIQTASDPGFNKRCVDLFNEQKPDIVFMQIQSPGIISNETCKHFKDNGAFVINWTGDKRHVVPQWMIDIAPYVSLTSFSNMEDVYKMREAGFKAEYLEIGYDEDIYTPIGEAYNVPEIVFFGNNYGAGHFPMSEFRIKMVDFLQKEYGNRFGVYGNSWPNAKGNINHSQHEEAKHYRGTKIAINCSHFDSDMYNSDRLLRILGSGTMCLSYKHKGMSETYIGKDYLDYFEDFDKLKFKIDYYLHNTKSLDIIANNGNEFVKNTFTFNHQVKNIISFVK